MSERQGQPEESAFNELFIQSVDETITGILGKTVSNAFTNYVRTRFGLEIDAIPERPETLFSALHDSLGAGGDRVGKYIVRKLYQKAGIEFQDGDNRPLADYVQQLKRRLTDAKYH